MKVSVDTKSESERKMKMLKAYVVSENRNYEHSALVFAENPNKAKQQALGDDNLCDYEYIELSAKRAKYADGHENTDESDLIHLKIRNGWWYEIDGHHIDSDNLGEMIERGII